MSAGLRVPIQLDESQWPTDIWRQGDSTCTSYNDADRFTDLILRKVLH
jgi:hypothetical protein